LPPRSNICQKRCSPALRSAISCQSWPFSEASRR
jgi:hypothetical protein